MLKYGEILKLSQAKVDREKLFSKLRVKQLQEEKRQYYFHRKQQDALLVQQMRNKRS